MLLLASISERLVSFAVNVIGDLGLFGVFVLMATSTLLLPQSRWADVGGPVHYREWEGPADGPIFVCVHGLGGSLLNWAGVAPGLARHGRVVALDLAGFGLTAPEGHGFQAGLTAIDMTSTDPVLAAGFTGDVTVYLRVGEMFWGVPGPGALKVATAKGDAQRSYYFAYPAGAMMVKGPAAGKRLHFFFAVHAPAQGWHQN